VALAVLPFGFAGGSGSAIRIICAMVGMILGLAPKTPWVGWRGMAYGNKIEKFLAGFLGSCRSALWIKGQKNLFFSFGINVLITFKSVAGIQVLAGL
jgi:hypothetical protein